MNLAEYAGYDALGLAELVAMGGRGSMVSR